MVPVNYQNGVNVTAVIQEPGTTQMRNVSRLVNMGKWVYSDGYNSNVSFQDNQQLENYYQAHLQPGKAG
jgi:hypothetical protein